MKKSNYVKSIGIMLIALFALVILVSCGGKKSAAAGQNGKVVTAEELEKATGTLEYWSCFTGDSLKWDEWRIGEFAKAYPNVKINMQSVPDSAGVTNGKLLSAIASGNPPDVIVADDYVPTFGYAGQGAFEPWDPYLAAIDLSIDSFMPGFHNLMEYDGKTYLLPQDSNVYFMFINTELADAAGLDYVNNYPKTLDELTAWADKLTKKDAAGNVTQYGFIPWADRGNDDPTMWPFMFGADIYIEGTNKLDLTDQRVVAAFEYQRQQARKFDPTIAKAIVQTAGGFFSPAHPFFQKKLAMTISGNWTTNALRIYAPDIKYVCVPIPVPAGGRANATTLGSNVFAIPKGSKRPDLAALFFKFTQRAEINADNFDIWRSIPCVDAIFDDVSWTKKEDPIYKLERELANSPLSGHPALCAVSAELAKQLANVRDECVFNNRDPLPLLKEVQERLQPELDKAAAKK
jgi:ABC-type glycerol-3-phosphate transport system substrate-binding protein